MRIKLLLPLVAMVLWCFSFTAAAEADAGQIKEHEKHLVFVKAYQQEYDWVSPWNKKSITAKQGMALVVTDQHLLTTAELVENYSFIEVRKAHTFQTYQATVVEMDVAINQALLKVEDAEFWQDLEPVTWKEAETGDVEIVQPELPDTWNTIQGKIEKLSIGYRRVRELWLPFLKITAEPLKGGEGHAVLQDGKVIAMGIQVSQGKLDALPSLLLRQFAQQSRSSSYRGYPQRGFTWSRIPRPSFLQYYQIDPQLTGVWIARILHDGTGADVLQYGDFLYAIDQWPISNEGNIQHPQWGSILFDYLFAEHLQGGEMELKVMRQGQALTLKSQVSPFLPEQHFIPLKTINRPPGYVLRGGLLFQDLSMDYLYMWGEDWAARAPLRLRLFQQLDSVYPENKGKHLVLLTRVLPDIINIGYQELRNIVVTRINQQEIHDLSDVVTAFQSPENGFHQIHFLAGSTPLYIILPQHEITAANQRILKSFQIPRLEVVYPPSAF